MITLVIRYWYWIVIAALLACIGIEHIRGNSARTALYKERAEFADERTRAAEERLLADRAQRHEEQRREDARRKVIDDARSETAKAMADAAAADTARDGLQRALATYTARVRAREDSAACGRGKSEQSPDALDLLGRLLSRADQEAGELARHADALRIAGRACERQYDSLTPP